MLIEERAVSPVVGAALLITITVILAVVLGAALFDGGPGPVGEPETTLSFEVDENGGVVLAHEGGDPLDPDEVVVTDSSGNELSGLAEEMTAGDRQQIADSGEVDALDADDRISVVWQDPRGDGEQILGTFRP